jgi:CBS domain-containing protein
MKKVAEIFKRKGRNTISIHPDATVYDALKLMADRNIGSVVVLHHEQYLGLMTERDYSRKVILQGKASNDTRVKDIMTVDLPRVSSEHSLGDCMELMSNKNIRYLPVFDQGHYSGIISINDVVRETISSQQETIEHLQNFIHSS